MLKYLIKRLLGCLAMVLILSFVSFIIINLPDGDYVSTYVGRNQALGRLVEQAEIDQLIMQYGLDQSILTQYANWITGIVTRGDFGRSFIWNRPVADVLAERLPLTIGLVIATLLFQWIVSIPVAIYSATRQYSPLDYAFSVLGFIGISVPSFLIGLIAVYVMLKLFNFPYSGLFSGQYDTAPWNLDKLVDAARHIWLPVLVLGAQGTATLIRTIRGNLIDELPKQYVTTARAKGLEENRLLVQYPLRVAINPAISTVGWSLSAIFSAEIITSIVLNLESVGPAFIESVKMQDVYLAGSILLILCTVTVVGTVVSDILLALADPRIRIGGESK